MDQMAPPQFELFDCLQKRVTESRKTSEVLLALLKERASHEDFLSKGLERLRGLSVVDCGSLGRAFSELTSDCGNKAEQAKILAESIAGDLVETVKTCTLRIGGEWRKAAAEGKNVGEEAKRAKATHDTAYQRYKRISTELEQLLSRLDSHPDDPDTRYADISRLMSLKREYCEAAKLYKSAVDQYSAVKQRYDAKMVRCRQPQVLGFYLNLERTRRETMKDVLRKLVVYETAWLRNLQYETEKMAKVLLIQIMESIDVSSDINTLSQQLSPVSVSIPAIQYRPWPGELSKPDSVIEDSLGLLGRIRRVTGRLFQFNGDEKAANFLSCEFEKACEGGRMRVDEEYALHTLLKEGFGRHYWVSCLEKKTSGGKTIVSRAGLGRLEEHLRIILAECAKTSDADLPLSILSLSPRVCLVSDSDTNLLTTMASSPIWQQSWLWEQAISRNVFGPGNGVQTVMEALELPQDFIQNTLGGYVRKPSLSVSDRKALRTKSSAPRWLNTLDASTPLKVRASISLSQMLPSLHTDTEDPDPEKNLDDSDIDIDLSSPETTVIMAIPAPCDLATKQQISKVIKVRNLPWDASEQLLKAFFSPCGVAKRVVMDKREAPLSAILEFETTREAAKAVNLTGFDLHSCVLTVQFYTDPVPDI